jgi:hypothetical protein
MREKNKNQKDSRHAPVSTEYLDSIKQRYLSNQAYKPLVPNSTKSLPEPKIEELKIIKDSDKEEEINNNTPIDPTVYDEKKLLQQYNPAGEFSIPTREALIKKDAADNKAYIQKYVLPQREENEIIMPDGSTKYNLDIKREESLAARERRIKAQNAIFKIPDEVLQEHGFKNTRDLIYAAYGIDGESVFLRYFSRDVDPNDPNYPQGHDDRIIIHSLGELEYLLRDPNNPNPHGLGSALFERRALDEDKEALVESHNTPVPVFYGSAGKVTTIPVDVLENDGDSNGLSSSRNFVDHTPLGTVVPPHGTVVEINPSRAPDRQHIEVMLLDGNSTVLESPILSIAKSKADIYNNVPIFSEEAMVEYKDILTASALRRLTSGIVEKEISTISIEEKDKLINTLSLTKDTDLEALRQTTQDILLTETDPLRITTLNKLKSYLSRTKDLDNEEFNKLIGQSIDTETSNRNSQVINNIFSNLDNSNNISLAELNKLSDIALQGTEEYVPNRILTRLRDGLLLAKDSDIQIYTKPEYNVIRTEDMIPDLMNVGDCNESDLELASANDVRGSKKLTNQEATRVGNDLADSLLYGVNMGLSQWRNRITFGGDGASTCIPVDTIDRANQQIAEICRTDAEIFRGSPASATTAFVLLDGTLATDMAELMIYEYGIDGIPIEQGMNGLLNPEFKKIVDVSISKVGEKIADYLQGTVKQSSVYMEQEDKFQHTLVLTTQSIQAGLKPPEGYELLERLPAATASMPLIKTADKYSANNLVTFDVCIYGLRRTET